MIEKCLNEYIYSYCVALICETRDQNLQHVYRVCLLCFSTVQKHTMELVPYSSGESGLLEIKQSPAGEHEHQ